ncbi:Pyoverdine biosynthesis [Penicillium hordei]|uniref:Pyoverdine biosynthesis n=1 Tax=Penicillium hordei TaxID=40994 RepID=A0AAD6EFS5_9EURO|nr:Pyoverdine biosynthesis [Penicillium hordei]KAJ5616473.1 Pyoverdine biosynthesis [Penicillium hordei]
MAGSIQEIQPEAEPVREPFSAPALVDGVLGDSQDNDTHTQISEKILAILEPYLLTKSVEAHNRSDLGATKFISVIRNFISKGQAVQMCLPAFPWKSANKVYKVLGTLPDKAEELSLKRLNGICEAISGVYKPGAELLIVSDGLVYNDLFTIPDRDVWAYGEALRALAIESGCTHIRFTRLKDLVDIPGLPDKLEEITYVANALNFRRALLNQFGNPNLDVTKEIAEKDDTRLTYCGYTRFLKNDLRYIFPIGENRSSRKYLKDVKYVAKQMIYRGSAFGAALERNFPDYLRLSIHQSTGEHKISISLLATSTSYTTPWHCSVAFLADGTLTSGPKGDFESNPKFELVCDKDGRPSYFRERETGAVNDDDY